MIIQASWKHNYIKEVERPHFQRNQNRIKFNINVIVVTQSDKEGDKIYQVSPSSQLSWTSLSLSPKRDSPSWQSDW